MKKRDSFEGQKMLVLHKKALTKLRKNKFTRDLYATDVGYFPNALYHYRERESGCLEYILIFCIKGFGWVKINGKRSRISKNQYIIIPKLEPHTYEADNLDPWTIYWIHFAGEKAPNFVYPLDYPREIDRSVNSAFDSRVNLFEEIYYTLEEGHLANNLEYSSVLLTSLLGSFKYHSLFRKAKQTHDRSPISKAVRYMKDNLERKLSIQELATSCGLSVSHFCLLFKRKTSHTPIEHLTFLRMQKACYLLDFSSLRINEIAHKLGYDDAYYFTRVFKKVMGKSPSMYRNSTN
ncbi:AraC family transcriptional regulator [Ulvibacterium sp.]|uniref:AraC family transcriptional regulator n=1 Tax=Ulvibacterium sp. TaxID=2665914 RepID=UPI003BA84F35